MKQNDNWGWKARIGMFIVSSEAVPEAEWWAMIPAGVSVHAARVAASAPWATWSDDRSSVGCAADLERGAKQFAAMRLSVVVIGHSSSSIMGGRGWDETVVKRLAELVAPETRVTTNGLDCQAALMAMGVKRPFLVFPAWFGEGVAAKGVEYFAENGFPAAGHMRVDPGQGWRDVAPTELYPMGMGFEQDAEALYRQVRDRCPSDADGVLIVGTGLRCVAVLDCLEQDLGRPVVSANQASLWHCLRLSGVRAAVVGYGRLFQL